MNLRKAIGKNIVFGGDIFCIASADITNLVPPAKRNSKASKV